MPAVTFVILHYMAFDVTVRCIESILDKILYPNYTIVVVDNGSPNNTGEKLKCLYKDNSKIYVLCLESNKGFSAGNNVGYLYAKEQLLSDYIIMLNNDTEIIQADFVQKAIACFEETSYYVLGPDIINADGEHQNPARNHTQRQEAKNSIVRQRLIRKYLLIHKMFHIPVPKVYFHIMELRKKQKKAKTAKSVRTDSMQTNVSLYGACFVFSPMFVKNSLYAFEELTFMYGEEELLRLRCQKNRWKIVYSPDLKILHIEGQSTKAAHSNNVELELFYAEHVIKAYSAILKNMKK